MLYVGRDPDEVRPHIADVRMVAEGSADSDVFLCTGRREPWTALWPRLRSLTVG